MMTDGVIWRQLIGFAVPLLLGNLLQQLYNTVDSIVVGQFIGSEALAAVSSSNSLINLIIGMFMGISTGAGVVISQYYGAKAEKKMQQAVHTAITLCMIGGVILIFVGILFSPFILRLMGTPEEVISKPCLAAWGQKCCIARWIATGRLVWMPTTLNSATGVAQKI